MEGAEPPSRELTCTSLLFFFPSTYAPVKPFLRVDKEKVKVGSSQLL